MFWLGEIETLKDSCNDNFGKSAWLWITCYSIIFFEEWNRNYVCNYLRYGIINTKTYLYNTISI